MRRICVLLLVLPAAAAVPTSAGAQSTTQIAQFWRAVDAAPTQAAALQAANLAADSSDDTLVQGILDLHAYELTFDKTMSFKATRNLSIAVERAPQNAWAHFALGAALARGPDVRERSMAEKNAYETRLAFLSNAAAHAPKELKKALQLDPSLTEAALELGKFALDLRDKPLMRETLKLLTSAPHNSNGAALILASRISNRLDYVLEGEKYARRAKAAGFDPSLAEHQRAVSLFRLVDHEESGAEAYMAGLDALTEQGALVYYQDLAILLSAEQETEWRHLPLGKKKEWLIHYWDRSAAVAGVSLARRLGEHFVRLEQASRGPNATVVTNFKSDTVKRPTNIFTMLFSPPPIAEHDDPLVTQIRYGDPTRTRRFAWCEPGWDTLPVPMQPTLSDCIKSPYGRSLMSPNAPHSSRLLLAHAREKAQRGEGYYPDYKRNLSIVWEALQFRAPKGGSQIVAAVGVRGLSAAALKNKEGNLEPALTLTLADTIQDWIRRESSQNQYSMKDVGPQEWILLGVSTTAPEGRAVALSVAVESSDHSAGAIAHGKIDVSAFNPDSLTMSDVVISPNDAFGSFTRGDVRVALAPGRSFKASEAPTLYYEIYGVKDNAPLSTEIDITPIRESVLDKMRAALGRDDGTVSLRFNESPQSIHPLFGVQQKRVLGLTNLQPGEYRMKVTVRDAAGRTVTRQKILQVDADGAR